MTCRFLTTLLFSLVIFTACNQSPNKTKRSHSDSPASQTADQVEKTPTQTTEPTETSKKNVGDDSENKMDESENVRVVEKPLKDFPGSTLLLPEKDGRFPLIVMIHGSDGGNDQTFYRGDADHFLSKGYAVAIYCYFKCSGTPSKLVGIRLENVLDLIDMYKKTEQGRDQKAGILGFSRGAEQSVLLASLVRTTDKVAAVAAHSPNDFTVSSFDPETDDAVYENGSRRALDAWTWNGRSIPENRRIEVEAYDGPMYLSHGTADEVWPVEYSRAIEESRRDAGLETEAHYWNGQGHSLTDDKLIGEFLNTVSAFFQKHLK